MDFVTQRVIEVNMEEEASAALVCCSYLVLPLIVRHNYEELVQKSHTTLGNGVGGYGWGRWV